AGNRLLLGAELLPQRLVGGLPVAQVLHAPPTLPTDEAKYWPGVWVPPDRVGAFWRAAIFVRLEPSPGSPLREPLSSWGLASRLGRTTTVLALSPVKKMLTPSAVRRLPVSGLRTWSRPADQEDVALSAFDSFYRAAEQGRFPRLHDRDDL